MLYYTIVCSSFDKRLADQVDGLMVGTFEAYESGDDYIIMFGDEQYRDRSFTKIQKVFGSMLNVSAGTILTNQISNNDGEEFI